MPHERTLRLEVPRQIQPDEVTCGPSCLSSVLRFHGIDADLSAVMPLVTRNQDGGTLAPWLGQAALGFGIGVRARPLAVQVFDPTWRGLDAASLRDRLALRTAALREGRLRRVHQAWLDYLDAGGQVNLGGELRSGEIIAALDRGNPLIAGLSVTWLYQVARERPADNVPDDIAGMPVGHFVVITGYAGGGDTFFVSDPWPHPPFEGEPHYPVSRRQLTQAILLGDATHDAVILELFR
jgi:hypothetical protein